MTEPHQESVVSAGACPFRHVGQYFVVDDIARTGRHLVCRWVEFAQAGRSHEVVAEATDGFTAWDVASAMEHRPGGAR